MAQYPVLLPGTTITLDNAGAPHATLVALVVLFGDELGAAPVGLGQPGEHPRRVRGSVVTALGPAWSSVSLDPGDRPGPGQPSR